MIAEAVGLVDAAGDRPGHAVGGQHTDPRDVDKGVAQGPGAGRQDEYGISVERRMHRTNGPRQAALGHDRDALRLGLAQGGVGGDGGKGGAGPGRRLKIVFGVARQVGGRRRLVAKLAVAFEGPGPEDAAVRHQDRTQAIDGGQGTDGDPVLVHHRGSAETALQGTCRGSEAGAGVTEGEFSRRAGGGDVTEITIGWRISPILVAAVQQIEEDRRRYDGNGGGTDGKAAPVRLQPRHRAAGRVEAIGGAAGKDDGVALLDRRRRVEKLEFAAAGAAAPGVDGGHHGGVGNDHGDAGPDVRVAGIADPDAGDIGDGVARPDPVHRQTSMFICP